MKTMTLELPDEVYEEVLRTARESQLPPTQVAAARVAVFPARMPRPVLTAEEAEAAMARLTRHFGRADTGDPDSANNERIDADLAREYGNNHEDES